jgi:hypothetical protein
MADVLKGLRDVLCNYLGNYMSQHTHPANRALHVVGVPLAPWGGIYLLTRGQFGAAVVAFGAGYGLQWLGHRIEGNQMGDWKLVKALADQVTSARRAPARAIAEERQAA